jgi:hypothetical protein
MRAHDPDEGRRAADQVDALQERLAALERLLGRQQEEIAQLRAALAGGEEPAGLILPASARSARGGTLGRPASRRTLLKLGGVAAAAGVAAVAADVARGTPSARAASVAWNTASTVSADGQTIVQPSSGAYTDVDLLQLKLGTGSPYFPLAPSGGTNLKAALAAYDTTSNNIGVYGSSSTGYGLFGVTDTGAGATGAGLSGSANSTGSGVVGTSQSGIGVQGNGGSGLGGSFTGGQAPLALGLAGAGGPPTSGAHVAGEIYADANGKLWVCNQSGSGSSAGWYPLSGVVYLSSPIRLLDTRPGQSAHQAPGAPIGSTATFQLQAANFTYQGQTIPSGAVALLGNILVAAPPAGGNLIFYPNGSPQPTASNIGFAPGVYTGNFTTAKVGNGNLINIFNQSTGATHVIFDCFAYVI